ncbi:MAG TPA: beta-N-acetylhexosaminidase [Gemmatimonadaceae bacterium]|nr:beta-N-acetylhexosaminidase [Gemmatimonadaceae bacterium]
MRVTGPLQGRVRVVVLTLALASAACRPASVPVPQPVTRPPQVVPAPASITPVGGAPFNLARTSTIVVDAGNAEAAAIGEMLAELLRPPTGFPVTVSTASSGPGAIVLRLAGAPATVGDEGYQLSITSDSIRLVANRPAGLFHGIQTIRQLLPVQIESEMGVDRNTWEVPAQTITDWPRFAWRGAMLDVARHFFTVREVEQYIDLLALYKLNVLHLHLSDDQGWRIQLNSRPRLTELGSLTQVGGGPGGFFTQQDYQNIIRYAAARYVLIVPEIDMPSHINSGVIAYPDLACGSRPPGLYTGTDVGWSSLCVDKEGTYAFIDDVIRELSSITPGPYFHIGGDEVQTLTNEQYIRFVERAQATVNKYGKKMIGWEEITKARLNPTTIAQQWKSDSATAAVAQGAKLIMSPANKIYLDMKYTPATELGLNWAAYVEVRDAYDWDPAAYLKGVGEQNILGVEAPIWSETVRNIGAVFFLALPRMPAVAEVGWTPQSARSWESFRSRVVTHEPRWRYLGWNYYRSPQLPW